MSLTPPDNLLFCKTANHNLTWKKTGSKTFSGHFSETYALVGSNRTSVKELIFLI